MFYFLIQTIPIVTTVTMRMQKYHPIIWVPCDTIAKQTVISDPCRSMDRQVKDGVSIPKQEILYKGP